MEEELARHSLKVGTASRGLRGSIHPCTYVSGMRKMVSQVRYILEERLFVSPPRATENDEILVLS